MQLAPLAIAAAALIAISGKKKKSTASKTPRVEQYGRVERLLNSAAINASVDQGGSPPVPSVIYAYASKDAALQRVTSVMMTQAETFQNVQFYQIPISALKAFLQVEGKLPKGIAGVLAGSTGDADIWDRFIYPNDTIEDISVAVSHRVLYATTGNRPPIKGG